MQVCLDPGHGGYDPGAVGNGLQEKDLTLDICLKLKPILEFNGINVVLTRDGDYAPGNMEGNLSRELQARVNVAEQFNVDLFVSIHINAGGGTGAEILIIGTGGNAERVAITLLPYLTQAGSWANRGVKVQNVLVLRQTTMPAILTENGFIDQTVDTEKLKDPTFRLKLARAHAQGICEYFGIQFKDPSNTQTLPIVMYRVILDGQQVMALSSSDNAIAEVKQSVDSGKAIKGIVQRNTDGVNIYEYTNTMVPPVTPDPDTPIIKTPIMGMETITVEQCRQFILKVNPNAPDIIPFYKKYGEQLGIRWGYAVAQMIKETGYLKFVGDVKASQNNFAGIGAIGNGVSGAVFATPEDGVIAHLEHLFAYASRDPLPQGLAMLDPRFNLVNRGSSPNWEDLDGKWAVPGIGYGGDIVSIGNKMVAEVVSVPSLPVPLENGLISILKRLVQIIMDLLFIREQK